MVNNKNKKNSSNALVFGQWPQTKKETKIATKFLLHSALRLMIVFFVLLKDEGSIRSRIYDNQKQIRCFKTHAIRLNKLRSQYC